MDLVRKTLKRDIEMLERLTVTQKNQVAKEFDLTLRGLDSWLHRIRERREELSWYFNMITSLEKRNSRLHKILLSAKLDEEEKEDGEVGSIPRMEEPEPEEVPSEPEKPTIPVKPSLPEHMDFGWESKTISEGELRCVRKKAIIPLNTCDPASCHRLYPKEAYMCGKLNQ
jgi:hypothetical protein